jgi:hypothetical protein
LSANPEVDALVRSSFVISDTFARDEGATEYTVVYEKSSKAIFKSLFHKLRPLGHTPYLSGTPDDAVLVVIKDAEPQKTSSRTPVFLVLLSALSIIATGWGVGLIYQQLLNENFIIAGATFAFGVTIVLLGRNVAQRLMAMRNGRLTTLSYYLPNIPFFVPIPVLYFLPTFGSITFLRSPTIDRDSLFDFYFVGALVGVAMAFLVALAGSHDAVVFATSPAGTVTTTASLLQTFAVSLGGSNLNAVAPTGLSTFFSPLEIAAWIGFMISFFSLAPAALMDGGRMATLVLGERGSRITTMVTAFILLAIDIPNYWVFFLLIFLLAAIQPSSQTLDSISGISISRRVLFLLAMALLLLCVPVPQTFLTRPI